MARGLPTLKQFGHQPNTNHLNKNVFKTSESPKLRELLDQMWEEPVSHWNFEMFAFEIFHLKHLISLR